VGGIFLAISLIFLIIGLIKKSSKLKKVALGIAIVPILCFGLIAYWYMIAIPSFDKNQMEDFAGTYVPNSSGKELLATNGLKTNESKLILLSDGTYKFDGIDGIRLEKSGTWKTGGIDGLVEFHDKDGSILEWASPSGSGDDSALSIEYRQDEDDWQNTKSILFVKK
jgi:hypothetical protein